MAPYLLLLFLFATTILVGLAGPKKGLGPRNYDREAQDAYNAAFEVISKKTAKRRAHLKLLLLIVLLVDLLLLVWIFRTS